jgi:anti-anti-sigma factor
MEITTSQQAGQVQVTVLHIRGEMTADTAGPFEAAAKTAINGGTRNLLLDLTDVPFIGSFGIRSINNVLVALYEANGLSEGDARKVLRTGEKAAFLKLLNPNPQVMNVLETSGFDMLLEVHYEMKSAVKAFS